MPRRCAATLHPDIATAYGAGRLVSSTAVSRTTKVPAGELIAATTIHESAIQHRIG